MASSVPCNLCSETLGPVLADGDLWRLVLNWNQNLLGKCFLVTRGHVEAVEDLTDKEWNDLAAQLAHATSALRRTTKPDHFNYAFLMNQDRHVHLHIIPRYVGSRTMFGLTFHDPDYPGHYAVPSAERVLTSKQTEQLAELLVAAL